MSRRVRPVPVPAGGFRDIAVLRLSSLGDVVLTLPVVHALARAFPEAKLHFWVKEEYADVVRSDPSVGHVRVLEKDARRIEDLVSMSAELETCDLIVDLHASARTRLLCIRQKAPVLRVSKQRWLRARWVHARWSRPRPAEPAWVRYARTLAPIGVEVEGPPRLPVAEEVESWAERELATWAGGSPWVAFAPAARHFTKRWPEERWVELLARAIAKGLRVVVFTLPRERDALGALAAAVEAAPGARWCCEALPRQAAMLGRAAVVVSSDSGLMHVAAARGARVVALFGSTSPVLGFAPAGDGHTVLCRDEPCQPCTLHGRKACPKGHFRCMRGISAEEVERAMAARLEAFGGSSRT